MVADFSDSQVFPEEYLAFEADHPVKHEYRGGRTYAVAGSSNTHVMIAGNLFALLRSHLRGGGCRAYISDTKAHIQAIDTYYYPDLIVSCDPRDRVFDTFLRYPCLIVEVMSDLTEAFDRGDKFADYRRVDTLQEYVLVNQKRMSVDIFRRTSGLWTMESYLEKSEIHLHSVDFRSAIELLYEDVVFADVPTRGDRDIL